MAPGHTERTSAMASSGACPVSTSNLADTRPARPSPPLQWTSTASPAGGQSAMDAGRDAVVCGLEDGGRHGHVPDRQVDPGHATGLDLALQSVDGESRDLTVLDQRHDGRRAPRPDCVKVEAEVAIPSARVGRSLLLPRAERQPDPATVFVTTSAIWSGSVRLVLADMIIPPFTVPTLPVRRDNRR